MSGLQFTVDDRDALEEEARLAAIEDAKEEAKRLAKELDVRLGDILSFNDTNNGFYPEPFQTRSFEMVADGQFGVSESTIAPEIAVGENKITSTVTITYEIK